MRLALALTVAVLLPACPLPSKVLYRCEADRSCAIAGTVCGDDDYCHPAPTPGEDGGQPCDPTLDLAARCAEVECGVVTNGCGEELDCGKTCQGGLWCGTKRANTCGLPELCTPEGWCWENPLPQGYSLNSGFRLDGRHTFFVGENRTVLRYDGEQLFVESPMDAPGQSLQDVHGTRPDDVFAVGRGGLIIHRVGARWETEGFLPAAQPSLRTVWSLGDGRALAGGWNGSNGGLYYRVPAAAASERWRAITQTFSNEVMDVYVDAAGEAWLLTRSSGIYRSTGDFSSWTQLDVPPLGTSRHFVFRDGAIYVGGEEGSGKTLQRRDPDGGYETLVNFLPSVQQLFADERGVYAVTGNSLITVTDGVDGGSNLVVGDSQFSGGAPVGRGEVMLVGAFGGMSLARPDGGTLLLSSPRSDRVMNIGALCGTGADVLFAAGSRESTSCTGECILRFAQREQSSAGVRWQWDEARLGGTTQLRACYALGPQDFWLTGDDSKFIYWGGGRDAGWGWGDFTGTYGGVYTGGWGLPDAGYYFARTNSGELTWSSNGVDSWQGVAVGTPEDSGVTLRSVWGVGGDDIVAVGAQGFVSRFDGTAWQSASNVANTEFLGVHGARLAAGGRRYVAVGSNGTILSNLSDGGPNVTNLGSSVTLRQGWVSTSGTAWAVGFAGDGGAFAVSSALDQPWLSVPVISPRGLSGLFGVDEADGGHTVWVSSGTGTILRRR